MVYARVAVCPERLAALRAGTVRPYTGDPPGFMGQRKGLPPVMAGRSRLRRHMGEKEKDMPPVSAGGMSF